MDEIGRSSLLKKAHHFFLRAVRCHLVSYFRVYPKITYQLPSLWHSRLSPHAMFVDTDGCLFRSYHQDRRSLVWLRSQHGHGTFPFDHYQGAVSFIYFWLWSLSHHVCDDHRCIYFFYLFYFYTIIILNFFRLVKQFVHLVVQFCGEREITSLTHVQLRLRC